MGLPKTVTACRRKQNLISSCRFRRNASSLRTEISLYSISWCNDRSIYSLKITNDGDVSCMKLPIWRPNEPPMLIIIASSLNKIMQMVSYKSGVEIFVSICYNLWLGSLKNKRCTLWFSCNLVNLMEAKEEQSFHTDSYTRRMYFSGHSQSGFMGFRKLPLFTLQARGQGCLIKSWTLWSFKSLYTCDSKICSSGLFFCLFMAWLQGLSKILLSFSLCEAVPKRVLCKLNDWRTNIHGFTTATMEC